MTAMIVVTTVTIVTIMTMTTLIKKKMTTRIIILPLLLGLFIVVTQKSSNFGNISVLDILTLQFQNSVTRVQQNPSSRKYILLQMQS